MYLTLLLISAFVQTLSARTFINPSCSALFIINHTQVEQASIAQYVQGFPETIFLTPSPLPSEILRNGVTGVTRDSHLFYD